MNRRALVAAAAATFAMANLASAQPASQPVAVAADIELRQEKAMVLARTVQPREIAVDMAIALLDSQAVGGLLAIPEMKKLEADHPGAVTAMWQAGRPILYATLERELPNLWQALAGAYVALTPAQLDDATAFYGSRAGQKLLRSLTRRADMRPIVAASASRPDGHVTSGDVNAVIAKAAENVADDLTAEEERAVMAFVASPTGRAMQGVAPKVDRATEAWMNAPDPESDASLEQAMAAGLEAFLNRGAAGKRKQR